MGLAHSVLSSEPVNCRVMSTRPRMLGARREELMLDSRAMVWSKMRDCRLYSSSRVKLALLSGSPHDSGVHELRRMQMRDTAAMNDMAITLGNC